MSNPNLIREKVKVRSLTCRMNDLESSKQRKILEVVYHLEENKKLGEKITSEKVVVAAWKLFPSEFSLRGYPEYPGEDGTRRILSNLKRQSFIKGGASYYSITDKGKNFIKRQKAIINPKKEGASDIKKIPRQIELEINRIVNSRVFSYFINGGEDFLETDLFEFLGTSSRSFKESNKTNFLSQYNLMILEVIPFCKKNLKTNEKVLKLLELWASLEDKFQDIFKNEK